MGEIGEVGHANCTDKQLRTSDRWVAVEKRISIKKISQFYLFFCQVLLRQLVAQNCFFANWQNLYSAV